VQIREQIRLRPPGDRLHLYRNYLVLSTGLDGFVSGGEHGLFVHEARVVSDYRYLVDGVEPRPIGVAAARRPGRWGTTSRCRRDASPDHPTPAAAC
jgi:hypothetical protein